MQRRVLYILAALGAPLVGVTLWLQGQPLICNCGYVAFWGGQIFAAGTSQQIADWYTLSHFLHGVLVVLFARAVGLRFETALVIAIVTGVGWEVTENAPPVVQQFRISTRELGYLGDSIVNSVSDYLFMLAGFAFATRARTGAAVAAILVFELVAALVGRDSLLLKTVMLVYPVQAIHDWQQELNPLRPPQ